MRTETFGRFGMRLAETASGLGFMFGGRRNVFRCGGSRLGSHFRLRGRFWGGGRFSFGSGRARNATAATTTPASAAPFAGVTRRIQIGFFVRHKIVP
jgi:hypothetical protein